ncbi:MAG: ferredoxin [Euryarchaeota archaeon CG_4_9_14_3_um_filter_38_12]|nr:MAG: ferredoxin [Euryarchaeota archaeon CG_4_9_14_3_um_filter_38_12]
MKVDKTKCMYCGSCVGTCPENAIFLEETSIVFNDELCIECGLCEKVCPVGAITMG